MSVHGVVVLVTLQNHSRKSGTRRNLLEHTYRHKHSFVLLALIRSWDCAWLDLRLCRAVRTNDSDIGDPESVRALTTDRRERERSILHQKDFFSGPPLSPLPAAASPMSLAPAKLLIFPTCSCDHLPNIVLDSQGWAGRKRTFGVCQEIADKSTKLRTM